LRLPQYYVGGSRFCRPMMRSWAKNCPSKVVRNCKKTVYWQQNQILKSRPKPQKNCPQETKLSIKKSSKVAKICPTAMKLNFKKLSEIAKNCPSAKKQNFKK
jgi:hypothetical protein